MDSSIIFVIILIASIVGLVVWLEVQSRRNRRQEATDSAPETVQKFRRKP